MMNVAAYLAEAATTFTLDINTIVLGVIGLIPAILTALIAMRQKEQNVNQAATVENLREIHTAVNSGKTTLENELKDLRKVVTEQTGIIKTLEENKRGTELAKAVATVPPVMVMPAAPPHPVMGTWGSAGTPAKAEASDSSGTPLENAISDLTDAAKETVEAADETLDKTAVLKDKVPKP